MSTQRQIALVSGGARGIGEGICRALAAAGHKVVVTDFRMDAARALAKEIDGHAFEMDVTSVDSVASAAAQINKEVGAPTILVNNAGWDSLMPFLETDEAFQEKVMAINYHGPVRVCRAFLPGMVAAGKGRVINIASEAARIGGPLEAIYSGAKGGVASFSKAIAREFAGNQITVNIICPGIFATPLVAEIMAADEQSSKQIKSYMDNVPVQRVGEPADIANAVVYLASDGASYVTGQTLSVSGGISMVG